MTLVLMACAFAQIAWQWQANLEIPAFSIYDRVRLVFRVLAQRLGAERRHGFITRLVASIDHQMASTLQSLLHIS